MAKSKLYKILIAIISWVALILQYYLSINKFIAIGMTLMGSIIQILSYFTILTNLLVAVSITVILARPQSELGGFFSKPSTATSITIYITIVGLVYNFILRGEWNPEGLDRVADELLHSLIPLMFVIYWIFFVQKGSIKWKNLLSGLIYPLVYSIYVLIRGFITGIYPYPFLDVPVRGYSTVFLNMLLILLLFLLI